MLFIAHPTFSPTPVSCAHSLHPALAGCSVAAEAVVARGPDTADFAACVSHFVRAGGMQLALSVLRSVGGDGGGGGGGRGGSAGGGGGGGGGGAGSPPTAAMIMDVLSAACNGGARALYARCVARPYLSGERKRYRAMAAAAAAAAADAAADAAAAV
jgi:hypothetical protein